MKKSSKAYKKFCREKSASRREDEALIACGQVTPLEIQRRNSVFSEEFCRNAVINDKQALRSLARSRHLRKLVAR